MPSLAPHTWNDIRDAYVRGASAKALSQQWGVSTSAIYRRAVAEEWAKTTRRTRVPPAPVAPAVTALEEGRSWQRTRAPMAPGDPPDFIADLLSGEIPEPGFLGRMAVAASGRALMNYDTHGARQFIKLADDYARVAERGGKINLHTVMRALFDRTYADSLFALAEGEHNLVKEIYWEGMEKVDAETAKGDRPAPESAC